MMNSAGLVAVAAMAMLAGCSSGPRQAVQVKILDGCTQQQVALVMEGMQMWNEACGDTVFRPAPEGEVLGDVRVLCSDVEHFGDAGMTGPGVVKAYYSTGLAQLVIPRVATAKDVAMEPALVGHELGHHLWGGTHRDEDPISIFRSYYTPGVDRPSAGDVRALREVGFDCWANGRDESKTTVQKPLAGR
jgi:hypothetical protein